MTNPDTFDEPTAEDSDDPGYEPEAEESEPIPRVVAWESLEASEYTAAIIELDNWVREFFVPTYAVSNRVIPSCWYQHQHLLHTISHLHTGWLTTRHPQAGTGMIGLDWDRWREISTDQLIKLNALAGCGAGKHRQTAYEAWITDPAAAADFLRYTAGEQVRIRNNDIHTTTVAAIETELLAGEDQTDTAEELLGQRCPDRQPEAQDIDAIERDLNNELAALAQRTVNAAAAARSSIEDDLQEQQLAVNLTNTRTALAEQIALPTTGRDLDPTPWIRAVRWSQSTQMLINLAESARTPVPQIDQDLRGQARRSRHRSIDDLFGGAE